MSKPYFEVKSLKTGKCQLWLYFDDKHKRHLGTFERIEAYDLAYAIKMAGISEPIIPEVYICPECRLSVPNDERVQHGMKCSRCAYGESA